MEGVMSSGVYLMVVMVVVVYSGEVGNRCVVCCCRLRAAEIFLVSELSAKT